MHSVEHLDETLGRCISDCSDCHDLCAETAIYAMQVHLPVNDIGLLLDCAQICDAARDFMLRASAFHPATCAVCADVCAQCAEMCAAHDNVVMRRCGETCRECAESCADMARMGRPAERAAEPRRMAA